MKTIQEKIAVMQHFANGGEVECADKGRNEWCAINTPMWNWGELDYRIKAKTKQVKMLCWTNGKRLVWYSQEHDLSKQHNWERVLAEDKIIEVEE